jgi:hypothetical protein
LFAGGLSNHFDGCAYFAKNAKILKIIDFTGHTFFVPTVFEKTPDFRSRAKKHMCKQALINFRTDFNK